jgi:hypothetical protein
VNNKILNQSHMFLVMLPGPAGDTCLNLEWRLRHGELPSASMSPRVVVVMCGTNDLRDAKIARDSSPARREHQTAAHAVLEAAPEIMKTCDPPRIC